MQSAIGLIGGGQMAEAIIAGLVQAKVIDPKEIFVFDPDQARRELLKEKYKINICEDNISVVQQTGVTILAVKPQIISEVLADLSPGFKPESLIVSIAAGVTLEELENLLPSGIPVIRTVPNTPALIGKGVTVLACNQAVTSQDLDTAKNIFQALGEVLVLQERFLDAVTGVSGSGPAYVYLFIEALIDGGVKAGLSREVARELAIQTLIGSAEMVKVTGKHPAVLKDMVTSPGGTTIAALHVLEQGSIRSVVIDAVLEAQKRAQELSKK